MNSFERPSIEDTDDSSEVREGDRELETLEQTENGLWLHEVEKGEQGEVIYERRRAFQDPENPTEDELSWGHEKNFIYNESGELVEEEGTDLHQENSWRKTFEWEEGSMTSEVGEISEGPDEGHVWKIMFERDENGNVLREEGKIHAQGKNPHKEPVGHAWQKEHYYDEEGTWAGAEGEIIGGPREGDTWTEGTVSEEEK